jgi:glycosyltransferase involved in cell wall biosynthesis
MKILTIIYNLEKGGTQRAAQTFAEAYHELKHDSRVLTLYDLGSRYEEIKNIIPVWKGFEYSTLEEIETWGPDMIHIHSHGPKKEDIYKILDYIKKEETLVFEQNVFSVPSPWTNKIDVSFQLSYWALWLYNIRGGLHVKKEIIPYPVKCSNFFRRTEDKILSFKKKYNIPKNAFVLGRVGQSSRGKWSEMLIDVFNEFAKIDLSIYLIIVNPPENIIQEAHNSPYKERIIHIPHIYGDDNLSIAYSSFDIMLHISEIGESFGYVLPESILCGTPVITLNTPWGDNSQCEVVNNLIGGCIVNSTKGFIDAVTLFREKKILKNFNQTGLKHIKENYDHIKIAEKVINLAHTKSYIQSQISKKEISKKIKSVLKNTFEKTNFLTFLIISFNNPFMRRFTLFKYPKRLLLKYFTRNIRKILWKK